MIKINYSVFGTDENNEDFDEPKIVYIPDNSIIFFNGIGDMYIPSISTTILFMEFTDFEFVEKLEILAQIDYFMEEFRKREENIRTAKISKKRDKIIEKVNCQGSNTEERG